MKHFLIVLIALTLNGCTALDSLSGITDYFTGGEDNTDPPHELQDYNAEIEIEVLWKERVGVGSKDYFLKLAPAIKDGRIFAGDMEGEVEAFELLSGDSVWDADLEMPFSSGPGVSTGTVVFGTSDARVLALNAWNGEELWNFPVSSEVAAVPVIAQGVVIIRTTDGKVIALDESTGRLLWDYELIMPALSIRGTGNPVVVNNNVICGFANGKLVSLRLNDGKHVWDASIAIPGGRSEIERLVDLSADPLVIDGTIYVASYKGGTSAVIEQQGEVIWRNPDISSYRGMGSDWRYLYVTDVNSDIWQLDQRNGASLWKQSDLHQRKLTAPAVLENYVVVGDFEGYVHWLSKTDGRQLARIRITDEPIDAQPIVVDDVIYVYAKDGTLAALKAKTL
ncbi:outer membrane protein assembly factor BamB [Methylicorpusculum sp.]|uniref:outer membrane protein assembly factor BamB n=1 Tax=Methylicorpusculum sp. TaxID=2713644 RepID=UPI0027162074|nr:outer membrane protein assembly factor BamB [Methylicorpusculum sp.]MDO8844687.1 outer membrane protein assembly factor BamB [Methylicorpusculum sp.]